MMFESDSPATPPFSSGHSESCPVRFSSLVQKSSPQRGTLQRTPFSKCGEVPPSSLSFFSWRGLEE